MKGWTLARVWPGDRLDDGLAMAIRGAFCFGRQRTLTQDVEFAIDQLVEIALRALEVIEVMSGGKKCLALPSAEDVLRTGSFFQ